MKRTVRLAPMVVVVLAVVGLVGWAARSPMGRVADPPVAADAVDLGDVVARVNKNFETRWRQSHIVPAEAADELQVLRRLSLSLLGTLPSLEEIRRFEADTEPNRLGRWTARILADSRFADYMSERLARSYVGTHEGQFIVYRRDRFTGWLRDQLFENRPYDEIVREMITETGLWTGSPATNFVTAAVNQATIDDNKLAARSVRAFLGQRIDCAQCHDHPFDHWTQQDFEGLAACFGQTRFSVFGVEDRSQKNGKPVEYEVLDRKTQKKRTVALRVPFHPEWMPTEGTRRERLAVWITHPENRRFQRAIVNRMWGYLFGKPYIDPVDGVPDPPDRSNRDLLDILGDDFREHGYDLRRLIEVIAASRVFRLDSSHPADVEGADPNAVQSLIDNWAVFPLTRLRPEQVVAAMIQTSSIQTIDQHSHLVVRFFRYIRENDFVKQYGDLGENELDEQAGTISQALLRMNGNIPSELLKAGLFSATGRIASLSSTNQQCLETAYLVCLTRRPRPSEKRYFLPQLAGTTGKKRQRAVESIYWPLWNSWEFSWNH